MTEPAPREMRLMRASCRRGKAACPMRGCDQRGWKTEQPVGRRGGAGSPAPIRDCPSPGVLPQSLPAMARAARLFAALAALLAAAATGDARPSKIGAGRTGWGADLGRAAREKCCEPGASGGGKGKAAGRGRGPRERSWVEKSRGTATGRGRGPQ